MKPSYEWTIHQSKTFSVTVRSWHRHDGFGWNVYANIYDTHPMFGNVEWAMNLPLHGGCTLDQLITIAPSQGIKYDWQREQKTLKVGSDYQHYGDEYFMHFDPLQGIPSSILRDANELVQCLQETKEAHNDK